MSFDFQNLEPLGWNTLDDAEAQALCTDGLTIARVIAVDREQYLVSDGLQELRARLSGKLAYSLESVEQHPCVGDWVCIDHKGQEGIAVVRKVFSRKTYLRRKSVGGANGYQMIASNVDTAVIVQACHYDFNIKRLERYLVMVRDGRVLPAIVLTKTDLVSQEVLASQIERIRAFEADVCIIALSNVSGTGLDDLRSILVSGKTYCFIGSSGIGKSTLINSLIGKTVLGTKQVSATGEGRHATVRRELLRLDNGAMVIDNPGMREFGVLGASEGMEESFSDIDALEENCRFRDCTHKSEPGCAVRAAVQSGAINAERYDNYLKLGRESKFQEMSYVERRKKDQAFGRFIKAVKKDLEHE